MHTVQVAVAFVWNQLERELRQMNWAMTSLLAHKDCKLFFAGTFVWSQDVTGMSCWKMLEVYWDGFSQPANRSKTCPIEKCQDSPWRGLEVKGSLAEHGCAVAQEEAPIIQYYSMISLSLRPQSTQSYNLSG